MQPIHPQLDPLAHKAAIEALEAQRAAYRRFARTTEEQRLSLGDGDGERAMAAAEATARGFDELERGARRLQPLLEQVAGVASGDELAEMQRRMDAMMREARVAESAIQNLTLQLEAWRDAYGRQLAELGLPPGGEGGTAGTPGRPHAESPGSSGTGTPYAPGPTADGPYHSAGVARAAVAGRARLLDRQA